MCLWLLLYKIAIQYCIGLSKGVNFTRRHIPDGLRGRHALTLNSPNDFNFLNYLAKEKKPYK